MIEHKGRVVFVDGDRIDVEMLVEGSCGECAVKGACGMGHAESKIVQLVTAVAAKFAVGEDVWIYIEERMGVKAALWAYVYPLFLLIAVLVTARALGCSEAVSGIATLSSVVVYWAVYRVFRKRIERELVFKIRKI